MENQESRVTTSNFSLTDTENDYFVSDGFAQQNGRFQSDFKQISSEAIGIGGYGSVFKAVNRFDDEEYAIKKVLIKGIHDLCLE
jgi:serine/threonine protein kinase